MRATIFAAMLVLAQWPMSAMAADDSNVPPKVAEQIRKQNSDLHIDSIHATPIDGVYEAVIGSGIFYIDRTGKYLISGHMFNTTNKEDITNARLEEINRIDWNLLPLDKAIVSGDPDGMPMAVFTDPDCPYCRQLEKNLKGIKGVKIYSFLFPLTQLHPDAARKAEAIWCSKDRHAALLDVMVDNNSIEGGGCKTPIADIAQLAEKLHIQGTPTLIAGDGRKRSGALPVNVIKEWLSKK